MRLSAILLLAALCLAGCAPRTVQTGFGSVRELRIYPMAVTTFDTAEELEDLPPSMQAIDLGEARERETFIVVPARRLGWLLAGAVPGPPPTDGGFDPAVTYYTEAVLSDGRVVPMRLAAHTPAFDLLPAPEVWTVGEPSDSEVTDHWLELRRIADELRGALDAESDWQRRVGRITAFRVCMTEGTDRGWAEEYTVEELEALPGLDADVDVVRPLLAAARYRLPQEPPFMSGNWPALMHLDDGSVLRLDLSLNTPFFRVAGERGSWELPDELQARWRAFAWDAAEQLIEQQQQRRRFPQRRRPR